MSDMSHDGTGDSPDQTGPYGKLLAKIESLDAYTHLVLANFPKKERHLLCADIRRSIADAHRLCVVAWKKYHKKTTLHDLDTEIEVLRALIRKSLSLRYIAPKRYLTWSSHVNEVGRMVGGWIKSQK